MKRHPQILNRRHAALLIVDVQQRIHAVMFHKERLVKSIVKLIKGCQALQVPIFITEQYPQGLGSTEAEILQALQGQAPVQKMTFSCCGAEELISKLRESGIKQIVVAGIESHVCVQQTALDLLAQEFQVQVPKEAVSSRKELD